MVKTKSAFTLIELVVMIAVVAIIAGLLIPTLSKARGKAYIAKCRANMNNLSVAFAHYSNDNGMYLPSSQCWQEALAPYLGLKEDQFRVVDFIAGDSPGFIDQSELNKRCEKGGATDEDELKDFHFIEQKTPFRCPSDYAGDKYGTEVAVNSYGINAEAAMSNGLRDKDGFLPYEGGKFFPNLSKVKSPQNVILLMEVCWGDAQEQANNLGTRIKSLTPANWIPPATVWADSPGWHKNQNPWLTPGKIPSSQPSLPDVPHVAWRHNEKAHACFMDGHVELVSPRQTVGMAGSNVGADRQRKGMPGYHLRGLDIAGGAASKVKTGQWFEEADWPLDTNPEPGSHLRQVPPARIVVGAFALLTVLAVLIIWVLARR